MTNREIGELFTDLHKYLYVVIYNRLSDEVPKDYAYDCLQETFKTALEKKDDKKFNANPKGWLIVTAKYTVDNFNRTYKTYDKHYASEEDAKDIPYSHDLLEDLAFKMTIEDHILEKIKAELSSGDALFFKMRFEYKMEIDAIAKELEMKPGAVHTKISRVKKKARALLLKHSRE